MTIRSSTRATSCSSPRRVLSIHHRAGPRATAFVFTLVPIRPHPRCELHSLRTFLPARVASLSAHPSLLSIPTRPPRRLATPTDSPPNSTPTSLRMDNYPRAGDDTRHAAVDRDAHAPRVSVQIRPEHERVRPRVPPALARRGRRERRRVGGSHGVGARGASAAVPPAPGPVDVKARSIHWSPYDHVGVVHADP